MDLPRQHLFAKDCFEYPPSPTPSSWFHGSHAPAFSYSALPRPSQFMHPTPLPAVTGPGIGR